MSKTNDTDIESFNCAECGIKFGIDQKVVVHWKKSHKQFVCPNGHTLSWNEPSADQKELEALRIEIKELKEKLAITEARVTELTAELELWQP